MNRWIQLAALAVFLAVLAPMAFGNNVPATQVNVANLWTNIGSSWPSGLTAASAPINGTFTLYSHLIPYYGTYYTQVFTDASGHLVFAYQITSLGKLTQPCPKGFTCSLDVQKISTGDWGDWITIDAKQFGSSSQVKSNGINRLNGVVTMYFQSPLIYPGNVSDTLLLYTNAHQYVKSTIGIQDGSSDTVLGYVPIAAEPATIFTFGLGLLGLGATIRIKRNA